MQLSGFPHVRLHHVTLSEVCSLLSDRGCVCLRQHPVCLTGEFLTEASSESLTSVPLLGIRTSLPLSFGNFSQACIKIFLA